MQEQLGTEVFFRTFSKNEGKIKCIPFLWGKQTNQDLILSSPVCHEIGFGSFGQNLLPKFYSLLCSTAIGNESNTSALKISVTWMPVAAEIP